MQQKKKLSFREKLQVMHMHSVLREKWRESLKSVLPITFIVLILCFFMVPVPSSDLIAFIFGAALLIAGMSLFSMGTEQAMTPIGENVGTALTRSGKLWLVLLLSFMVGAFITISEPDLAVLAKQVPGVPDMVLILAVAVGVGIFLLLAMLRILLKIRLSLLLLVSYAVVFLLSVFVPRNFLAVAFDSGGVTTGPMTVPFILAMGVGACAIRSDKNAENDSFGLVALSSIGPILAVMLLGMIFRPEEGTASAIVLVDAEDSVELFQAFWTALPEYLKDVGLALAPIIVFFIVFQTFSLHLNGRTVFTICVGLVYTYVGLVMFLLGVNVGFMPVGNYIGKLLGASELKWLLIPIGMVIGWFVVSAEPAVHVLNQQVYELTAGAIPKKALSLSLSVGVAVSVGLSMLRVLTGLPLMYLLIPGYALSMLLMIFSPPVFTAIAFDSGGVASGPMTATFLLPLAMGACEAVGGNIAVDAFGVVAMVAMTPLIAIQILGIVFKFKHRKAGSVTQAQPEEIIEL